MRYKKGTIIAVVAVVILIISVAAVFFLKDKIFYDNHVVFSINGENINDSEFKFILYQGVMPNIQQQYENETGQKLDDFNKIIDGKKAFDLAKERTLESVKTYKIEAQEAKKQGITLTAEETKKIEDSIGQMHQDSKTAENIAKAGLGNNDLKNIVTNLTLAGKLRQQELSKISQNITISDEEAKTYYEKNKNQYTREMVRARHILIKTVDDNGKELTNIDQLRQKSEDILKRAKAGEDFAALARQYSEDPGSKEKGGEYTFGRDEMVKEFEDAAFALKPGEISGIVETQFGYHIIKLEEKYMKTYDFESIKQDVKVSAQYDKMLQDWIKNSKIIKNDKLYNSITI